MFPSWVAAKLDGLRDALRRDDCRLGVHTGPPRKGKSTLALRFARYIDPDFTLDRCTFTPGDFKAACVAAPPGSAITLDEAVHGGNSRRAMSAENVDMQNWLTVWGHRNLHGAVCYPKWSRLDGAIKDYVSYRVHHVAKGIAVWYDVYHPDFSAYPVLAPGRKFRFEPIPAGEFRSAYEAKKNKFTTQESKPEPPAKPAGPSKKEQVLALKAQEPTLSSLAIAKRLGTDSGYVRAILGAAVVGAPSVNVSPSS